MRILKSQKEIEASTANPAGGVLGFDINAELDAAMNKALAPIAGRLREYRAEQGRLIAICERWTQEALAEKLNEIASLAASGDEEAAQAISNGAIPTKQAYCDMQGRTEANLANFRYANRKLFGEAAALIREPMTKVVSKGQKVVDRMTADFGIPTYLLTGSTNRIEYLCLQLENASNNLSHSLDAFWQAFK
jgi:hypothetical protein